MVPVTATKAAGPARPRRARAGARAGAGDRGWAGRTGVVRVIATEAAVPARRRRAREDLRWVVAAIRPERLAHLSARSMAAPPQHAAERGAPRGPRPAG